ncbi:MAG: hypothetical protein R6X35_15170 [Candidatus Krumholzibacteriia bacterium]
MKRTAMAAMGILGLVAVLGAGFLAGGDRAAVRWSALRAVVFESDDWGLAGFVPAADAWDGLDREALAPGRFPPVYWGSTLEDSAAVAALAAVLAGAKGRDGRPAVLQPNYIMGAQELRDGVWRETRLPELPAAYPRPGLWPAVDAAVRAGVWYPEYHGAWHYDPARRREAVAADPLSRRAAERGILLFRGSEAARELGPWRPLPVLAAELEAGLATFRRCFGRAPGSLIAPDYAWNARSEGLWARHGLQVVQGKGEQRNPDLPPGLAGRALKFAARRWGKVARPGLVYLERNCRFEPVQAPDPAAVTAACAAQVRQAWSRGEPAIVETHRVNFAHTDPAVAALGRRELGRLLADLGEDRPLFLTDTEVAQLARRGVSVRSGGDGQVIVRNGTRARRVAMVPAEGGAQLVLVPAGAGTGNGPRKFD